MESIHLKAVYIATKSKILLGMKAGFLANCIK